MPSDQKPRTIGESKSKDHESDIIPLRNLLPPHGDDLDKHRFDALVDPPMKPQRTLTQEIVRLSARTPVRVISHFRPSKDPKDQEDAIYPRHGLSIHRRNRYIAPHDHEYFEITLIHAGKGTHHTDHYRRPFKAGTVITVEPGPVHALDVEDGLIGTDVYYLTEWLLGDLDEFWYESGLVQLFFAGALFKRSLVSVISQFEISPDEMASCVHDIEAIAAELEREEPSLHFLKVVFFKMLITLGRAFSRECPADALPNMRREVWLGLEHIERRIAQCEPFHVSEFSGSLGLSGDHFSRLFKESTGASPTDYYQQRRAQHAGRLLLNPSNSVTEVAHILGYCNSSHFWSFFKRFFGMSPRDYRQKYLV